MFEANYIAILIAAVVTMIIGMVWYSPALFGKQWMALVGLSESDVKKGSKGPNMLGGFVTALVTAYVLSYFLYMFNANGVREAVSLGVWIWLGFYATSLLGSVLWEGKKINLYWIHVFYYFVSTVAMTAILVSF